MNVETTKTIKSALGVSATRANSLGEALRDALIQWKSNTALIEVNRREESGKLTYLDVRQAGRDVATAFETAGIGAGDRVAILMGNQSKWLIAAYAAFYRGAIVVPVDYKLTADEQRALLAHAKPKALVVEHQLWERAKSFDVPLVYITEAPDLTRLPLPNATQTVTRWDAIPSRLEWGEPTFVPRTRDDVATIVYSSGTGGTPKGCMLTHGNYLAQYDALIALYPLGEGHRYFSVLPTNHAIDFMCGFIGPFLGGATVVHQRALRPEFITWTMQKYGITHMAVVPLILEAFEKRIREQLDAASPLKRRIFDALSGMNESLTRTQPNVKVSRALLGPVHDAFGGKLEVLFCGGAFVDRARAEFFNRLGIPVAIGYGLTEACTVLTVHDLKPFRADSVGRAVAGVEIRIVNADAQGVGEVEVCGPTVMKGYLDEPELTAAAFRDGWLRTGDVGHMDASGHLHLVGRSKNMIVTTGGKNIYPEDVEAAFDGLPCDEYAVFAESYVWPGGKLDEERLVLVARVSEAQRAAFTEALRTRNQRLPDHKRVRGVVTWATDFPRTASMKLKREVLATALRAGTTRDDIGSL